MLARLAVAVACSLGAAALPVGAAAAAHGAPVADVTFAVPGSSWSTTPPALVGARAASESDAAGPALTGSAALDLVTGTGQPALPVGIASPPAAPRTAVVPVSGERAPVGLTPAALGSRAPPAR